LVQRVAPVGRKTSKAACE